MKNKIILIATLITWSIFLGFLLRSTLDPLYQGYVCMGGTMTIFALSALFSKLFFISNER